MEATICIFFFWASGSCQCYWSMDLTLSYKVFSVNLVQIFTHGWKLHCNSPDESLEASEGRPITWFTSSSFVEGNIKISPDLCEFFQGPFFWKCYKMAVFSVVEIIDRSQKQGITEYLLSSSDVWLTKATFFIIPLVFFIETELRVLIFPGIFLKKEGKKEFKEMSIC